MSVRMVFAAAALAIAPGAAVASDFGTLEEAQSITHRMIDIANESGVDAAITAMHDPSEPFVATSMGVHVFQSGIIVADNREPELIASSYEEVADLTNEPMWPRISTAADTRSEAVLEWYHYDTQAEYTYHCYSARANDAEIVVMTCR